MLCIKNGMVHNSTSPEVLPLDILVENGKIAAIGEHLELPEGTEIYDAAGMQVYPGFVEAHCHIGLNGTGAGFEVNEVNERTNVVTPYLRGIDGLNPMDSAMKKAALAGVTTCGTGPGSANVLGGTFVAVKTVGRCVDKMVVKDPVAMKCAFGENPKRVYREKNNCTRMNIAFKLREMLFRSRQYLAKKEAAGDDVLKMPAYDAALEAMIPVLKKEIPLKAHAHRADDILTAIRIAKEFDVNLTIEHCTEGHLIAEELAEAGYPAAVGPTFGDATKIEVSNKSWETPGILNRAGVQVSIITDSPVIPQHALSLCAGFAVKAGMDPFEALKAITINPAKHLGIEDRVGSLEVGKDADIVIADGNPMFSEARVVRVYIDGKAVEA